MTIVVAYVPTPEGQAALQQAETEATRRKARLLVVRAVKVSTSENTSAAREQARDTQRDREELDSVISQAAEAGIEVHGETVVIDRPNSIAESVLSVVDRENADLLVIGIRRRSPVGKAVMGSDAQDMLLQANCPVLAVKAD